MHVIRKSSFTPVPWKNGGGLTHEALRVPANEERFRWRVSVAQIDASGPFSIFSGYSRRMVLLHGDGIRLTFGGAAETLLKTPGDLAEFDGGLATACELLGGPCVDLNLIVSKSMRDVSARVENVGEPRSLQAPLRGTLLIFAVTGVLSVKPENSPPIELQAWDLALLVPGDRAVVAPSFLDPSATPAGQTIDLGSAGPLVFFATLDDNSR